MSITGKAGVVWLVSLTTKKISQHSTRPHASPEASTCARSSSASWVLLSVSVVTVETVAWVGTRIAWVGTSIACEIRFESRGWRSCRGVIVISGVTSLSVILPPLGQVPTEEQLIDSVR